MCEDMDPNNIVGRLERAMNILQSVRSNTLRTMQSEVGQRSQEVPDSNQSSLQQNILAAVK